MIRDHQSYVVFANLPTLADLDCKKATEPLSAERFRTPD